MNEMAMALGSLPKELMTWAGVVQPFLANGQENLLPLLKPLLGRLVVSNLVGRLRISS